MSQYIGKTISLISNKGLRYVGLLDNINAEDATVALKSVRPFGTEGRMAQAGHASAEVMPGTDVYEYVVFRGSDVKDLSVLDIPVDQVQPDVYTVPPAQNQPPQPTPTQPTQPIQSQPAQPTQQTQPQGSQPQGSQPTQPAAQFAYPYATPSTNTPTKITQQAQPQSAPQSENRPAAKSQEVPAPAPVSRPQGVSIPAEEFDFESANARFSRENVPEATGGYQKSSFFDTISSSTSQKGSMRWADEKSLNMDTFGEASVRGRGKRGRGNWRGRGRGRGRGRSDYDKKPEWA